jgi:2-methylisocitrate lyase-like PEP mutase family enzyme
MMGNEPAPSTGSNGPADETFLKEQKEKVRRYRKRLQAREVYVVPEVWDVISARVMADAGFELIGISAMALGWCQGIKQRDRVPMEGLVTAAERIASTSKVPVNADLEGILGYSMEEVSRAVNRIVTAGCIGFTIGDGGRGGVHGIASIQDMASAIRTAKAAALEARVPAIITARTEAFLLEPPQQSPFETAVERAEAYFAAGADCISIPGVQHIQIVERLSANIDGPLQITIGLTPAPDVKSLARAGVASISLGSALLRSVLGTTRLKAEELLAFGHFNHLDKAIPADEVNRLLG